MVEAWLCRWYIAPVTILPPGKGTTIMAHTHRRQFLKDLLGTLAQGAAGTIVLASAAATQAPAQVANGQDADIQRRADELAAAAGTGEEDVPVNFVNGAFRKGGGGAFKNGGFANGGGGGAFKNGGFANGGGGGAFRNGAFRN